VRKEVDVVLLHRNECVIMGHLGVVSKKERKITDREESILIYEVAFGA